MGDKQDGRRRFLKDSALLAGLAVGAVPSMSGQTPGSEKHKGERSRFVTLGRRPDITGHLTPLQDLMGIITPSALHFVQTRGYDPPEIDPRQHRLMIHGMVDRPLIFTMDELKRFPSVSRIYFLECGGNSGRTALLERAQTAQQIHGKTSCSEWTGVPLSVLLQETGVQPGASWIVAEGLDAKKRTESTPLSKAMDDALIAYGQNGEPLRPEQGFPIRLLLPGWDAGKCIKWLRRIKVVEQSYWSKQEASATGSHTSSEEMPLKSVITSPSGGQQLNGPGYYEITGLAWSGAGAIRKVEVSTDGGRTWNEARLQDPVLRFAHARFCFSWRWDGSEAVIQSRCTDEKGIVQPSLADISKRMDVPPDYWTSPKWQSQTQQRFGLNAIQPWKITREGSVQNAMFS